MKKPLVLLACLYSLLFSIGIFAAEFKEGEQYTDIAPEVSSESLPQSVEGFFWYGCRHCFAFEPTLEKWLQNNADDIAFIRTPAILGRNWLPHAQAFYAAKQLGIEEQVHMPLFNAIHKDRMPLFEPTDLAEFISLASGKPAAEILVTMNNIDTRESVKAAIEVGRKYRLRGVPAVVIGGKYLIDPGAAGDKFPELVKYLLAGKK